MGKEKTVKSSPENELAEHEKEDLKNYKESRFGEIVEKVSKWENVRDEDGKRVNPNRLQEKDLTVEQEKPGHNVGKKATKFGWDLLIEQLGGSISTAFGVSGDEQVNGAELPWFSVVRDSVERIGDFIQAGRNAIKEVKNKKKEYNEGLRGKKPGKLDAIKIWSKSLLKPLSDSAKTIADGFKEAKVLEGAVPIIGLVSSVISGVLDFVENFQGFMAAFHSINRMKEQKAAAKKRILENQGDESFVTQKKGKLHFNKDHEKLHQKIVEHNSKGNKKWKRTLGLDEVIINEMKPLKEKRQTYKMIEKVHPGFFDGNNKAGIELDKQKETMLGLQDYAVTKELISANHKRELDAGITVLRDDLMGIASAIAKMIGPGGLLAGLIIDTVTGGAKIIHSGISGAVHWARNSHLKGTDANKTDKNKAMHRQNLAVFNYKNIRRLAKQQDARDVKNISEDTTEEKDVRKVRMYLPKLIDGQNRVEAMGLTTNKLLQAKYAGEMIKIMRMGFYRDVDRMLGGGF